MTPEPLNLRLIFKKNFKIYSDALRRYPGDFTGYHAAFSCRWKGDRHGNFLADRELPGGFNKNAAGTNITDRCDKRTISGFTRRCRQNFIKALSAVTSAIHVTKMFISAIKFGHTEKPLWYRQTPTGPVQAPR